MAAARSKKQQPVGSAAWIAAEKENVAHLIDQEMEEVEFPVRHEMDWLNEHMVEIFSTNQFNVTEIFKTPGKLRGKTPRTARKRNVLEPRVPLSDIFSASPNKHANPAPENRFNKEIAKITAVENAKPKSAPPAPPQNLNSQPKYNTDSGYHGMTDDEMDMVVPEPQAPETATQPLEEEPVENNRERISPSVDRRTTEGSFHSAQEAPVNADMSGDAMAIDPPEAGDEPTLQAQESTPKATRQVEHNEREPPKKAEAEQNQAEEPNVSEEENHELDIALDHHLDDIGSPSDGSTPDRPLIRKSSLSFASLPAREPLTTKKSMGGSRMSRTSHVDQSKLNLPGRSSYFGRQTGGSRLAQAPLESNDDMMDMDDHMDVDEDMTITRGQDHTLESRASKLHNKSSTQRLHERITMLGKSQQPRPTKSIPAVTALGGASQVTYPELPSSKIESTEDGRSKTPISHPVADDDDDEWIKKPGTPPHTQRPQLTKSHTTDVMEQFQGNNTIGALEGQNAGNTTVTQDTDNRQSPGPKTAHQHGFGHGKSSSTSVLTPPPPGDNKTVSASNLQVESTTPTTSPKRYDGPLSASKSKLQSIMKTAKGLFTSSAGVSAAAKMETFSPTGNRSQQSLYPSISGMLGAQESQQSLPPIPGSFSRQASPSRQTSPFRQPSPVRQTSPLRQASPIRQTERATQGSLEKEEKRKEKEVKDRQRVDVQLEKAREKERQKASQPKDHDPPTFQKLDRIVPPAPPAARSSPRKAQQAQNAPARDTEEEEEPKSSVPHLPPPQNYKQNESRRPAKPTREAAQKPKPQPVNIRVGTLSQRIPMSSANSLSSSVQESNPPPATTKQPTLGKKASNSSLQTGNSTNNFKSSTSSKPKALLAAERKKEQEERETQRKLEQKRELERKRAAQEDSRRQNQKSRAETEAERRERERERAGPEDTKKMTQKQAIEKRRLENARKLEQQRNQQATPSSTADSMPHQERQAPPNRVDQGPARAPSRMNSVQPPSRPPPNPAKPPKRALEEESNARSAVPKSGVTSQQADSKRRKTEEEFNPEPPIRPTMAPPIRQSNIRKETTKPPVYTHGYTAVPPQQSQGGPSAYKHPGQPSHHMHQGSMQSMQPQRQAPPVEMAKYASGKIPFAEPPNAQQHPSHKTPGTSKQQKLAKSSPHYPNGDQIKLPEIPTDSEDEDSDDNSFPVPDWAQEEQLQRILEEQDGKDGDQVFGPIAPLRMEEIFTGKDRAKRFRDRTSSANWAGPDGLTRDEVKKDLAAREQMRMNGGWTFGL